MMTTDTALMFARYSDWADQVLFQAIDKLPPGSASQPIQTLFGSMVGTLNHNYQVDLIWRAHLEGKPHGFTSRRDVLFPDIGELARAQAEVNQWYIDWAGQQDVDSLNQKQPFTFLNGKAAEMTRGGMFMHIVTHKGYHRGWVSEMFFGLGGRPPQFDLSVYLCET